MPSYNYYHLLNQMCLILYFISTSVTFCIIDAYFYLFIFLMYHTLYWISRFSSCFILLFNWKFSLSQINMYLLRASQYSWDLHDFFMILHLDPYLIPASAGMKNSMIDQSGTSQYDIIDLEFCIITLYPQNWDTGLPVFSPWLKYAWKILVTGITLGMNIIPSIAVAVIQIPPP